MSAGGMFADEGFDLEDIAQIVGSQNLKGRTRRDDMPGLEHI